MTHLATPGDTIRITTRDVTLLDADSVARPVTEGLTGAMTLMEWESGEIIVGPTAMTTSTGDDWYADVTAPAAGRYRIVVVLEANSAQRTLAGELKVGDPPT